MKLVITTPMAVVVERDDVLQVRARDDSGAFGILPGHTRFLTVLAISVLTWRERDGTEGHVALRGGVLTVDQGRLVQVASREAVVGEDLEILERNVLASFRLRTESEKQARSAAARLELAAIRHIHRYLRPGATP